MSVIAGQVVASYRRFDASLLFSVDGLIEEQAKRDQEERAAYDRHLTEMRDRHNAEIAGGSIVIDSATIKQCERMEAICRDDGLIEVMKQLIPACDRARREMSEFDRKLVEACKGS